MTLDRFRPLHLLAGLACALASAVSTPASAADWQFSATPYLMFPSMSGDAQVGPLRVDVSTSPGDVFSNLNWGFMGLLEAHNGVWGVNLDLTYMNLDATDDRARGSINGHQGAYSATGLVRVAPGLDVYAGMRVNSLGLHAESFDNLGQHRSGSRSRTWVDPLIGARAVLPIGDTFDFTLLVDLGGFGIGSDVAAQVWPSFGWKVSNSVKVSAGYRLIYTDYSTGEGANRFVYDITTFGPTLGISISF
ncbi:hypothetical protein FJQ54_02335 [Sandaracinobacter neustonicus]|uniref:Outer membrane protein beta-barrel domain-containing protein n=1 Tax=Sandaracinobacter neustonicus TaxID=1715348 RepID=A0A501XTM3_9SPHN|nr:hypothetical protein [Sandaracinobacter neustonicus]TPE63713.1 hypothetical protein FJQ54_02335 [Sandaracinobacter neustonicus]